MSTERNSDWRPTASRAALEMRARLLADIRQFFAGRGVMEVETPLLSAAGNSDPNIDSFSTADPPQAFLRTSPEYPLKRLLAAGVPDVYEMGRVFRRGEKGAWHNPEFTLLEWYRLGWDHLRLAGEVVDLVRHCSAGRPWEWECQTLCYRDLLQRHAGLDPFTASEEDCAQLAAERGITAGPMALQEWLDLLLTHVVQPALGSRTITIVCDFPPEQAALARIRPGALPVAERFEIYLGSVELANGYRELADATEQRARFERDNRVRRARGQPEMPLDDRLLTALQHGLPDCAGVALGVDRLLMVLLGLDDIAAVLSFAQPRA